MPDSDATTYVRHIARSADLIEQFMTGKSQDDYVGDVMTQSAVERQLTIIGEALTQLARRDEGMAGRISEYQKIIGLRNLLVARLRAGGSVPRLGHAPLGSGPTQI